MKALSVPLEKVDTLGMLLAQIKDLTDKAEAIKDEIKESASMSGDKHIEGNFFCASYIESNRSTINWKKLAKDLAIDPELIAKYTETTAVYSVKVTSR